MLLEMEPVGDRLRVSPVNIPVEEVLPWPLTRLPLIVADASPSKKMHPAPEPIKN
jgi:hypothetical protein